MVFTNPDDVIRNPEKIIQELFKAKKGPANRDFGVTEYFKTFVDKNRFKIPTLHPAASSDRLIPKGLTRVVGMIQNPMDSEYFLAEYDLEEPGGVAGNMAKRTRHCGMYLDPEVKPGYTVREPKGVSQRDNMGERQIYQTISAPFESDWVPSRSTNMPIPAGFKSPVDCLVKIYHAPKEERPKVTELFEFYGIWIPAKDKPIPEKKAKEEESAQTEGKPGKQEANEEDEDAMDVDQKEEERRKEEEKPGLLPHVLHCVWYRRLGDCYPLIQPYGTPGFETDLQVVQPIAAQIRSEIRDFFEEVFKGDRLLSEYLLLHMMSSVAARKQSLLLGNFTLNLCNCPRSIPGDKNSFANIIAKVYKLLIPRVALIDMSLKFMNKDRWVPVKNHESGNLSYGIFQAPDSTFFIFNETAMQSGTLEAWGVLNVRALSEIVADQKVEYDFEYHPVSMNTNFPILILSEGEKSIITADTKFKINTNGAFGAAIGSRTGPLESISERDTAKDDAELNALLNATMEGDAGDEPNYRDYETIVRELAPDKIQLWRKYLMLCRSLHKRITFDPAATALAQKDWVAMRQRDKKNQVTDGTLHYRINLARALALTYAESTVSIARFNEIRGLERDRMDILGTNLPEE